MTAGRPATPTATKKLQGTYRPDRDGGSDARLRSNTPTCPAWLDKDAKAEWRRIANELHDAGLLKFVDRAALAAYCQAWARWMQAELLVQKIGLVVKTTNGNIIPSPAVGIANVAMRDMIKALREFGMTPSSRARLIVAGDEEREPTLAEQLFSIIGEPND